MVYKYGAMAAQKWLANPNGILPDPPATNIEKVWSNRCHFMALPACHVLRRFRSPSHSAANIGADGWSVGTWTV